MVSTIYSIMINNLDDECIEKVRCSFSNFEDAFSFAKYIANEYCGISDFFIQDSNGFTLYDEYKVPFCIVSVEANNLYTLHEKR